jgi:hypothetical protein
MESGSDQPLLSPVGPPRFFKTFVLRDFNVEPETEVPMA